MARKTGWFRFSIIELIVFAPILSLLFAVLIHSRKPYLIAIGLLIGCLFIALVSGALLEAAILFIIIGRDLLRVAIWVGKHGAGWWSSLRRHPQADTKTPPDSETKEQDS